MMAGFTDGEDFRPLHIERKNWLRLNKSIIGSMFNIELDLYGI